MLCVFLSVNSCETEQVKDETLPICEELQISTEENPCRKDNVSVSTIADALEKLSESGALPK
jgi:hypothetical protein